MMLSTGATMRTGRSGTVAVVIGAALIVSACGQRQKVQPVSENPVEQATVVPIKPAENLSPHKRYELAVQLLTVGNEAQARAELKTLQMAQPNDRRVQTLLRQLDTDPRTLFGADSFSYTLRAGDTLFSLARRYLGDPLNFYGLARFNGISLPADLKPGATLQIPGRARAMEPVRPQRARRAAPAAATAAGPAPARRPAPAADPVVDRDRANRLRQQGLEQMTAGSINRAVTLLSQAASLDPGNAAIAGDLARARRIQATVRSH